MNPKRRPSTAKKPFENNRGQSRGPNSASPVEESRRTSSHERKDEKPIACDSENVLFSSQNSGALQKALDPSEGFLGRIDSEQLLQTPLELATLGIGPCNLAFEANRRYQIQKTRKDIKSIMDLVNVWCNCQLESIDHLALQLRGSLNGPIAVNSCDLSSTFDLNPGSGIVEHAKRVRGLPMALDDKAVDRLRVLAHRTHSRYRNCVMPLTGGGLPDGLDLERLSESSELLATSSSYYLDVMPKGDPKRIPLFAYRAYGVCSKIDARRMRLAESGRGRKLDTLSRALLEELLKQAAQEVGDMWLATGGTLYAVGVVWSPMLAQIALLGRAVSLNLDGCHHPVVINQGVYQRVNWTDSIGWNDGLEDVRHLFWPGRKANCNFGGSMTLETWSDLLWYAKWKEFKPDTPIDDIPLEVPIWGMLADFGAPAFAGDCLTVSDKPALQRLVLFDETTLGACSCLEMEFCWAVSRGVSFDFNRGSLPRSMSLTGLADRSPESRKLFLRCRRHSGFRSMATQMSGPSQVQSPKVFFDLPLDSHFP